MDSIRRSPFCLLFLLHRLLSFAPPPRHSSAGSEVAVVKWLTGFRRFLVLAPGRKAVRALRPAHRR